MGFSCSTGHACNARLFVRLIGRLPPVGLLQALGNGIAISKTLGGTEMAGMISVAFYDLPVPQVNKAVQKACAAAITRALPGAVPAQLRPLPTL